jgi:hypothetical protein
MKGWLVFALAACPSPHPVAAPGVQPAVLVWRVGIDQKDPGLLVETIVAASYQGRPVWRVVHRDLDPTTDASSYDLYDVDPATLAPVRSATARDGFSLVLGFAGDRVTIDRREGDAERHVEVTVAKPMPEGPGAAVFYASLPLAPGFTTQYVLVDRWDETTRVKQMDLSVGNRTEIATALGRCDVLDVVTAPRDGSFRIHDWVRAEPPHYAIRTEYTRGTLHSVSEVVAVIGLPACR